MGKSSLPGSLTRPPDPRRACGTKVVAQTVKRMLPTPQFQIDEKKNRVTFTLKLSCFSAVNFGNVLYAFKFTF